MLLESHTHAIRPALKPRFTKLPELNPRVILPGCSRRVCNGGKRHTSSTSKVLCSASRCFSRHVVSSAITAEDQGRVADDAAATLRIPRHWEKQIQMAPLGKRRVLHRYVTQVAEINALEPAIRALSDAQLAAQTVRFREVLQDNRHRIPETLDQLLPEAFATVREASRRVLGMRHFDSQLVGGMVLHEGHIAEMATGEGKTLVAVLAAYLNALPATLSSTGPQSGSPHSSHHQQQQQQHNSRQQRAGGVHVVTVNEYLAARDAEWMGKVFRFLGLTVGAVQSNSSVEAAQAAYSCHVTYVTGQELCFNYLKDNTAQSAAELMLPDALHFAIVDEVDSVLIDESRNPMIISQPRGDHSSLVVTVDKAVKRLWQLINRSIDAATARQPDMPRAAVEAEVKSRYLLLDTKQRSLSLSQAGMSLLFTCLAEEPGVTFRAAARAGRPPCLMDLWEDDVPWGSMALTALKAYQYFHSGVQYIVRDGAVVIVDESTGRVRPISRYSGGLHQAIEAKEGVQLKPDSHATASITFQVFFRFYQKLSGMTGTAQSAAAEFYEMYGLRVVPIPTNKPQRRLDHPLRLYYTEQDKLAYVVSVVESCWASGRPVLIGTSSVNESELVLQVLQDWCRPAFKGLASRVQLLNAKPENVRLEAQIVAQAGLPGAVTIATNMAGRGTDIILGGNPEGLTCMGLLRLIYKWLLPREGAAAGGDGTSSSSSSSSSSDLDSLCPAMPLDVFQAYEVPLLSDVLKPRSQQQLQQGLPRDLHLVLLAAMMFADLAGRGPDHQGLSHADVRQLAAAALSAADIARRATLQRLRDTFGECQLQDLDFSSVVAPKAEAVFEELGHTLPSYYTGLSATVSFDEEQSIDQQGSSPELLARMGPALHQVQEFAAKTALFLWLWFDQQCEGMAQQVASAGGLLVLGTSLQEAERIELQLRGRAGRQGDPGSTQLLFDLNDPVFSAHGMQTFQQLAGSWLSSGQLLPYQESMVVDMLHKEVQKSVENQWQMARLETKRYDEVLEVYRRNLYSLRRLILTGDSQQRSRVVHMFIQQWVDALVDRLIDSHKGPAAWIADMPAAAAAAVDASWQLHNTSCSHSSSSSSAFSGTKQSQQVQLDSTSPLGAVMWHIQQLVNPASIVSPPNQQAPASAGIIDHIDDVINAWSMSASAMVNSQQLQQHTTATASVPIRIGEVQILTAEQLQQLAAYIVQGTSLPWPRPAFQIGLKTHVALAAHAKLFGMPTAAASSGYYDTTTAGSHPSSTGSSSTGSSSTGSSSSSSGDGDDSQQLLETSWSWPEGILTTRRPPITGKHAAKVGVLRDYLGTELIQAYELRQLTLKKLLVSSSSSAGGSSSAGAGVGLLDLDAELYLESYCRSIMLEWIDALWSCFLEDADKMRHSVGLKAYNNQQPLDEFRLEANRAFLVLLDSYRDAVVSRLMVPDLSFTMM